MEDILSCPVCHTSVRPTDYFCFNCGQNLHPEKLSTSTEAQASLYVKCIFLLPMGIVWGMRYLRQQDQKSKTVGWIAIGITIVVLYIVVAETLKVINTVNSTVNSQLNGLGGF